MMCWWYCVYAISNPFAVSSPGMPFVCSSAWFVSDGTECLLRVKDVEGVALHL